MGMIPGIQRAAFNAREPIHQSAHSTLKAQASLDEDVSRDRSDSTADAADCPVAINIQCPSPLASSREYSLPVEESSEKDRVQEDEIADDVPNCTVAINIQCPSSPQSSDQEHSLPAQGSLDKSEQSLPARGSIDKTEPKTSINNIENHIQIPDESVNRTNELEEKVSKPKTETLAVDPSPVTKTV